MYFTPYALIKLQLHMLHKSKGSPTPYMHFMARAATGQKLVNPQVLVKSSIQPVPQLRFQS